MPVNSPGTGPSVVDASVLGALCFGEPSASLAEEMLAGKAIVAPALLHYEMASICVKKVRQYPRQSSAIQAAYRDFERLELTAVDIDYWALPALAIETGLTVYDCAYLWLARSLSAELLTFDNQLAKVARQLGIPA